MFRRSRKSGLESRGVSMAPLRRFGLGFLLLASACSDASGGDPAAGGGGMSGGGSGGSGGAAGGGGGSQPQCAKGPGYRDAPEPWEAGRVTANLVGLDGAPAAGVECQLCG